MSADPLPSDIDPFVLAERVRPAPGPSVEQRVLERLNASIAALPPAAAAPTAPSAAPSRALQLVKGTAAGKLGIAAVAFLLGTGAGIGLTRYALPPVPAPPVIVPMVVMAPAAPQPPAASAAAEAPEAPQPETRRAQAPAHAKEAAPKPVADDALHAERALIDIARTAMSRGRFDDAVTALEQHQARFLWGQLAEEREVLWVGCLLSTGRKPEAETRAAAFRQLFPHSPLLPAMDTQLGR